MERWWWVSLCVYVCSSTVSEWVSELCVVGYALCVVRCVLWVVCCCVLCVVGKARCVVGKEGCRWFSRPPINVPTTGQRGVGSTEAEPFGKDEGIDLSAEAGGNIFAYVLQAAKPAARASLVSTCRPIMKQDWRWTCSFSSIANARSATYQKESSVIITESESIFNSDLRDVQTSRWPRLPCPLKAKFAKKNVGSCKLKVIIKTPSTGAADQRQKPALE